ncbi:MAG: tetratricopeptide repeat protein [Candidatus Sulfotelmatobacter sp.]
MRVWLLVVLLGCCLNAWAQSPSKPDGSAPANSSAQNSSTQNSPTQNSSTQNSATPGTAPSSASQSGSKSSQAQSSQPRPNLAPPQADRVDISALDDGPGESSSKDTDVDLSPPADDARAHPQSAEAVTDAEGAPGNGEVSEFHPWDPHKAAKDVEVGDFYFKKQNYAGAESRYREALYYKDNDAVATYRLAVCLEKMDRPDEAVEEYQSYLKILPQGPQAEDAKKAIARLTKPAADTKPAK